MRRVACYQKEEAMDSDSLKIDLACTVIRLSSSRLEEATLVEQAEPYLAQNRYLVLDAGGINFSSMEIGELMNLADDFHKAWAGKACYIAVSNLTPSAKEVFSMTKLDQIFPTFGSISEALDYFGQDNLPELKAAR